MSYFAKTRNMLSPNAHSMLYKMGTYSEKVEVPCFAQLCYEKKYEEFQSKIIN